MTDLPALGNSVRRFLAAPVKLLIDGQLVPSASGQTFPSVDPATETVVAQVAEGAREDVDRAVRAARRALVSAFFARSGIKVSR